MLCGFNAVRLTVSFQHFCFALLICDIQRCDCCSYSDISAAEEQLSVELVEYDVEISVTVSSHSKDDRRQWVPHGQARLW
jgi:hypothetical protein